MKNLSLFPFFKQIVSLLFSLFFCLQAQADEYITCNLSGQLGNQLFLISSTLGLAWDNGATPVFPNLDTEQRNNVPFNKEHIFFRLDKSSPKDVVFSDKRLNFYKKVSYEKNINLAYFDVRLDYFGHYQNRLQEIFAPSVQIEKTINRKYGKLLDSPNTVGIQIRVCQHAMLPFSGWDFYLSAMKLFPKNSLFIVCSDQIEWVKKYFPVKDKNIIFIDDSKHYLIDFYLLTKCKNIIIGGSTFGYWAAFLNKNPNTKVIAPSLWLSHKDKRTLEGFPGKWNVYPKDWIVLPVPLVRKVPSTLSKYLSLPRRGPIPKSR